LRLSDELQAVYIASHWARQFNVVGGMIAMLDMIYLLRQAGHAIRWEPILAWLQGSSAATPLYLMLAYLQRYQLIHVPSEVLHGLFVRQHAFGRLNYTIMRRLIDRYLAEGRAFGRVLSCRNLAILWKTLLVPGPPLRNLMLVPWNVSLPSRLSTRS
jgi:hypothetical protein